ncbi:(deoxy)nucleoside triphosphate pyrophosphohydrolase [Brucepastera parasyntrophica]|uniref:(deoxy)nucleoside triphosphate pyrophosphohydrolase n=1 Tax=Brucepastera parasyntrophica TaxID=2880008 RepID=UPI002109CEA0|nr:(deoxy)nucleoside triphosphate pyrophosphohydrolase [Brucepastera parasyntrophica]ULQ60085.1 (deoxy)nucleoside triphosphate pyrophosphohydrolase [Brucepastera parasyntrophica]
MRESVAAIMCSSGKFLIGHRLPEGEMGGRWEFPGGKVDEGETPESAIVRELREEMGIEAVPEQYIASIDFSNKNGPVRLLAFTVRIADDSAVKLTEHSEIKWATLEEIEKMPFVDSDRKLFPFLKDLH